MGNYLIDRAMEKTVLPSFSRIGIRVRAKLYQWQTLDTFSLEGKVVVLTGGTSGIGKAAAIRYASMGATLVIVARDSTKTAKLIDTLTQQSGNYKISSVIGDLGSLDEVRHIADQLNSQFPAINVLAHNAGALYNQRQYSNNGTDLSVELMVSTPFLLNGLLLNSLKAGHARVLSMSSGGMYTAELGVKHLQMPEEQYQGAQQYARAKRAQVVLNEMWSENIDPGQITFHALHPGWVDTPGINEALPGFSRILGPLGLLRTPDEGADTLVWLSANPDLQNCTGKFWHDRRTRDIDMSHTTRNADTTQLRERLWQWCETQTRWSLPQE